MPSMRVLAPIVIALAVSGMGATACSSKPASPQASSTAAAPASPSSPSTSPTPAATNSELNGTYAVTVDNGKRTVNGLATPTPSATSTWTITSTCDAGKCSGQVTSDQGWNAPAEISHDRWTVMYDKPDAAKCPDGTSVPATLAYSFDARVLNGIFTTVTKAGACGPGQIVGQAPWALVKQP